MSVRGPSARIAWCPAAVGADRKSEHPGLLADGCAGVVAKDRRPPIPVAVAEDSVVASVFGDEITRTPGAAEVTSGRGHAGVVEADLVVDLDRILDTFPLGGCGGRVETRLVDRSLAGSLELCGEQVVDAAVFDHERTLEAGMAVIGRAKPKRPPGQPRPWSLHRCE